MLFFGLNIHEFRVAFCLRAVYPRIKRRVSLQITFFCDVCIYPSLDCDQWETCPEMAATDLGSGSASRIFLEMQLGRYSLLLMNEFQVRIMGNCSFKSGSHEKSTGLCPSRCAIQLNEFYEVISPVILPICIHSALILEKQLL